MQDVCSTDISMSAHSFQPEFQILSVYFLVLANVHDYSCEEGCCVESAWRSLRSKVTVSHCALAASAAVTQ